jgi:hypothetical protein
MKMSGRSGGMVLLVAGIALTATAQLNRTVAVLPKPVLPVPLECEQGLAPQKMARLDVSQIPEPQISAAANAAPPSVTLRDTLRDAQSAAERNDRGGFTDALARARTLVDSWPPGSERTVAADAVRVFNDVDRVWSYQFDSPTGAFFDASNPLLAVLRTYAGYDAFVADNVITTGGTKLYPSHESRMFLLRESARRLARLGVRSGVQVTRRAMPDEDRPTPALPRVVPRKTAAHQQMQHAESKHAKRSSTKAAHTKTATASTTKTASTTETASTPKTTRRHHEKKTTTAKAAPKHLPRHEPAKMAEATPPKHESARYDTALKHETTTSAHETAKAVPPPVPAPVTTTTPPGSMTATNSSTSSSLPPITTTASSSRTPGTTTAAPLTNTTSSPATSSSSSTTTAPETTASTTASQTASETASTTASPTMSDTSATSSTAPASSAAQPSRARNLVLPIILILLGVGVLVVLFRASS